MSRVLNRILALAGAAPLLGAALVAGAPAAHASVPTCSSTPLYDFTVLGVYANRLAVESSSTETRVCFVGVNAAGVLVVRTTAGVNPPTVTQTTGTLPCAQPLWDSTQPLSLHVSVGHDTSTRSVCLSIDGDTTVLTFGLPSLGALPGVELWRTGTGDLLDVAACAVPYARSFVGGPYSDYVGCATSSGRIL